MQILRTGAEHRMWSTALLMGAAVAMAIGFSACQLGSTSANGGGNPSPADATISFCDDGDANCTPATSFSVATVRDLVVNVNWENLPTGTHMQLLEISMPGGGLYQAEQSSFLIADSSHATLTTSRNVPVAGAWISQRRITGEWSVRVSLDGNVITSQTVQLNP